MLHSVLHFANYYVKILKIKMRKDLFLQVLRIFHKYKKQITGIEPAFPAWEASVLPMNHICKRNIKYYTPCSFILPVLIFTILLFIILLIQHSQPLQSVPDAVFIHVRGDIIRHFQHLFTGIAHSNTGVGIL